MSLIRLSHHNPTATVVAFLVVAMLGVACLFTMPVQLTPDLERPTITVLNFWRAAAPAELEEQITEPQEALLRSIPGVREIRSSVRSGMSITSIEFVLGSDMQQAFMNVINALNQAPAGPRDASEPMVTLGGLEQGVATMMLVFDDPQRGDFTSVQRVIQEQVKTRLQRIPGVAAVNLQSHRAPQLHVAFDPYRMAALNVTLESVRRAITGAADVSGGFAEVGRREYTVRFEGKIAPQQLGELIVAQRDGRAVHLNEIAEVSVGHARQRGFAYRNGQPAYYISLERADQANTVAIMDELRQAIDELNNGVLAEYAMSATLSFDSSVHIRRAVNLVKSSLGLGIVLAMGLLYLLLRGWRATLLIGVTIPFSLCAALLVLGGLGRSLNIISLAGLAFAVGLVLDAAIVVQDQFLRLHREGMALKEAAIRGVRDVLPALFASTATTVAIFAPVLVMQGVEGQLFFDLAISMSVAVITSMLAAVFLLPVLAVRVFSHRAPRVRDLAVWSSLSQLYARLALGRWRSLVWVTLLLPGALWLSWAALPKADMLPKAKWEGILGVFSVPPGANYANLERELGRTLTERLAPYQSGEKAPAIDYNLAMTSGGRVLFVYPKDPKQADAVLKLLREEILVDLPDTRGFAFQQSLLNLSLSAGPSVYVNFYGDMTAADRLVAEQLNQRIADAVPGAAVRALDGLRNAKPELRVRPYEAQLASAGVSRGELGNMVRALTDGLYIGEYFDGHQRMDVLLRAPVWQTPEQLAAVPMPTDQGTPSTIGQLSAIDRTVGPTQLRRIDGRRAVTLAVTPPEGMSLEAVLDALQPIVAEARAQLSASASVGLSGSADDLAATLATMKRNFAFAVVILFLIMMAVFRSARDSLLVLSAMPMALAGGVMALRLLGLFTFQALDLLTMIGFVILLGLVVNNAILIVDKTRREQIRGHAIQPAVRTAIAERVRPVFMSSLTSVVGMLPLALMPGAGSEIYRGLATIIVGGMLFSTLFLLLYLPAALALLERTPSLSRLIPSRRTAMPVKSFFSVVVIASLLLGAHISQAAGSKPVVSVAPVTSRELSPTVLVTGRVQARATSQPSAGVAGRLEWIAEPGASVQPGDVIARLNDDVLAREVRQLEAKRRRQAITVEQLATQLERIQSLQARSMASQRESEQALTDLELARADHELLGLELEAAREAHAKAVVRAPFAGLVTERLAEIGEEVTATTPLMSVVDTERLDIAFYGPLAHAEHVRQAGTLAVHHSQGETRMSLRALIPVSDARSQTFTGLLQVPGEQIGQWPIGSMVSVAVPTAQPATRAVVPRDALVIGESTATVFVIEEDNVARAVNVSIVGGEGDYVSVDAPLVEGQRVVIRGAETLRSGTTVRVLAPKEFPIASVTP